MIMQSEICEIKVNCQKQSHVLKGQGVCGVEDVLSDIFQYFSLVYREGSLDDGDDSIPSLFVLFTRVVITLSKHWLHPQPVWRPHYHLSNGF